MSETNNPNRRNSPPAVNARLSGLSSLVYGESSIKNTYIKEGFYVLRTSPRISSRTHCEMV